MRLAVAPRAALVALVASAAVAAFLLPTPTPDANAAGSNRAGVVVRQSDGTVRDMCVFFDEEKITGYELIKRSGFDFEDSRGEFFSKAICKIGPDGCDTSEGEKCFCDSSNSWNYNIRDKGDSSWKYSLQGPSDRVVRDGSIDGWSWGKNGGGAPKPPALKFSDVCPQTAAAPTRTPDKVPSSDDSNADEARGNDNATGTSDTDTNDGRGESSGDDPSETPSADVSLALASVSPASTSPQNDQARSEPLDDAEPRSYLVFAGFAGAFVLLAGAAYFMQRRRAR